MNKNILLLEGIHQSGAQHFKTLGYSVDENKSSLGELELKNNLLENRVHGLGIRSKTHLGQEILKAPDLEAVGAFCIGTNQIDLKICRQRGIPVFNAPYSNTRSVAELVISHVIALSRRVFQVSQALHNGVWQKSAVGSNEVRGKVLGIVGYGHIGTQVGLLAESLGMRVAYYDIESKLPLGNAQPSNSLEELLRVSDFVTLHVPETELTANMIGTSQFKAMKPASCLINASRGSVVDLEALALVLRNDHLTGAAVDVFPEEPRSNGPGFVSPLQGIPNVILTPHIGGSTEEAQKSIGAEVSLSLEKFFSLGDTSGAVNFPRVLAPSIKGKYRLLHIHRNEPGVLAEINSVVSKMSLNINFQSLATQDELGYLVMDIDPTDEPVDNISELFNADSRTIRVRVIQNENPLCT